MPVADREIPLLGTMKEDMDDCVILRKSLLSYLCYPDMMAMGKVLAF